MVYMLWRGLITVGDFVSEGEEGRKSGIERKLEHRPEQNGAP